MKANRRRAGQPALKINQTATQSITLVRPIYLSETPGAGDDRAVKTAERLLISCRENVAFLNRQLAQFASYLELPPVADNVLYLAYTIGVRESAPFSARELRRWLADAGIETRARYRFGASSEQDPRTGVAGRMQEIISDDADEADSFCLACHQYLTILDLRHIVETIESFVSRFIPADPTPFSLHVRPEGA
jgi:dTDP-4-amino-4,6-dideoxygalactose transaminase